LGKLKGTAEATVRRSSVPLPLASEQFANHSPITEFAYQQPYSARAANLLVGCDITVSSP